MSVSISIIFFNNFFAYGMLSRTPSILQYGYDSELTVGLIGGETVGLIGGETVGLIGGETVGLICGHPFNSRSSLVFLNRPFSLTFSQMLSVGFSRGIIYTLLNNLGSIPKKGWMYPFSLTWHKTWFNFP